MSLSSEQDLLHLYLLRDVLEDMIKQMEILMEKYSSEGWTDMYCKGYLDGLRFSCDKVEQFSHGGNAMAEDVSARKPSENAKLV